MAPPGKSLTARALSGTIRKDRLATAPSSTLKHLPRAPRRLSEGARPHWYRVGRRAMAASRLRDADLEILAVTCESMAALEAATRMLARGPVIKSGKGTDVVFKANPALRAVVDARHAVVRCLCELGLTPRTRSSVDAPLPAILPAAPAPDYMLADGDGDDLDAFLRSNPARNAQ